MTKEEYKNILNQLLKKAKTFIFSMDVFAFLFFLTISAIFWIILSLSKTNDDIFIVPVKYINTPKDIEFSADLPSEIDIKLRDKGSVLLFNINIKQDSLIFDFKQHPEIKSSNKNSFPVSTTFEKQIKAKIPVSTQIIEYYPSEIVIEKGVLKSKRVPVILLSDISCDSQYCMSEECKISPSSIKIYATQEILENIDTIFTDKLVLKDLTKPTEAIVNLKFPNKVKSETTSVKVQVPVEIIIEGELSVPVKVVNVPEQYHIKTMPREVIVKYNAGKSKFKHINASEFNLVIDYNEIIDSNSKSQYIIVKKSPKDVINLKLSPESVEYIVY